MTQGMERGRLLRIDYTNWRGVRAIRLVAPIRIVFMATQWHPGPQYLLEAVDVEKGETRLFAMRDVHDWILPNENWMALRQNPQANF